MCTSKGKNPNSEPHAARLVFSSLRKSLKPRLVPFNIKLENLAMYI